MTELYYARIKVWLRMSVKQPVFDRRKRERGDKQTDRQTEKEEIQTVSSSQPSSLSPSSSQPSSSTLPSLSVVIRRDHNNFSLSGHLCFSLDLCFLCFDDVLLQNNYYFTADWPFSIKHYSVNTERWFLAFKTDVHALFKRNSTRYKHLKHSE